MRMRWGREVNKPLDIVQGTEIRIITNWASNLEAYIPPQYSMGEHKRGKLEVSHYLRRRRSQVNASTGTKQLVHQANPHGEGRKVRKKRASPEATFPFL